MRLGSRFLDDGVLDTGSDIIKLKEYISDIIKHQS